ncbi:MAG: hypothetical protein OEZ22_13680 [Spirochaetia bacterium]|nr:hypothetical protein [Spirochaetia bacterium]
MSSIEFSSNKYWREKQQDFTASEIEKSFETGWEKHSPPFVSFLPDENDLKKYKIWAENLNNKNIDNLLVVGIGGSALAGKTIKQYYAPFSEKVVFWEGPHPQLMQRIAYLAETKNTALLWISKSGKTLESVANLALFRQFFPGVPEYFVTSKPEVLKNLNADEDKVFIIPDELTGRYSAISAVGLLPGYFLGANMDNFLKGFKEGLYKWDISNPLGENGAKMAAVQYHNLLTKGYKNIIFWIYARELLTWGDWLIQLWGESLGKKSDITAFPCAVRGPEAQHSLFQYFLDSHNEFIHTFIHTDSYGTHDTFIPDDITGDSANHSLWDILQAQMKSIEAALTDKKRPVSEFLLPDIYGGELKTLKENENINRQFANMKFLGEWMAFWMCTVTYLGNLYDVNPFNQPAVELGKKHCREYLKTGKITDALEKNMEI